MNVSSLQLPKKEQVQFIWKKLHDAVYVAHSGQSNAGIFRTKKLFKDNSSYHNYMRLANRGEVVDKALVTLKFELPSNSGPVDICTFHFMALICGQIFQKDTSTLASHADVNEALRTSAWEAISTSKMG